MSNLLLPGQEIVPLRVNVNLEIEFEHDDLRKAATMAKGNPMALMMLSITQLHRRSVEQNTEIHSLKQKLAELESK